MVDFVKVDEVKRNAVRGLHKKRAKRYDESDSDSDDMRPMRKRQKAKAGSFQAAFNSILKGERFSEDKKAAKTPILAKYKKPERVAKEERETEEAERAKRADKERQRV